MAKDTDERKRDGEARKVAQRVGADTFDYALMWNLAEERRLDNGLAQEEETLP